MFQSQCNCHFSFPSSVPLVWTFFAATRAHDWALDIKVSHFSNNCEDTITDKKTAQGFCQLTKVPKRDTLLDIPQSCVTTIFLASGRWTTRSILSVAISILVIGRVGVHNIFNEEKEELEKVSLLGKVCIAISVLPVFVQTALFKIGSFSVVTAWNEGGTE